jgi:hypothetical protein
MGQKLAINEGDCVTLDIIDNRVVILPPNMVPNPTQLLSGLAKGLEVKEPINQELLKASAAQVEKKLSGSK